MTKFEEEVDKVAKQVGYESLSLLIGDCEEANKIYIHFKNWHSDEEFQELLDKYSNLNDNYEKEVIRSSKLESQITGLKSQLQQQALPVVPECVDLFIKECRKFNYDLDQAFYEQEDGSEATENNKCILWRRNHPDEFARAWLYGYTVEKPQLFYLRDELTGQFLAKDNQFKNEDRYFFWNGVDPLTHSIGTAWKLSFTQQEIDSMQTGSYELVPVEDE